MTYTSCDSCGREAEQDSEGVVACPHCGHIEYCDAAARDAATEKLAERAQNYRSAKRRKSRIKFKVA